MAKTIEFRTTKQKFDLQPVEPDTKFDLQPIEPSPKFDLQSIEPQRPKTIFPPAAPEVALLNDPNDVSLYERQPKPKQEPKPERFADVYGDFDVWAAPSDSQIWKSPGADFTRGFGAGWIKQTQIPALMGKKLPPAATRAEKIGESAGRMMEAITELIGLGAVLRGVGLLPKAIPKGALAIEKAMHTGVLFGTQQATEEVRKATAEAIYDEDFGSRGGMAILESFALGATLSLAGSGAGKVWQKLRPIEQAKQLKILGLKKGASLHEINKAARIQARRFHPDKVKGMRAKFDEVINARDALRKANAKDIIIANAKQNFKKRLMEKVGVSEDVADIAIQRLNQGEAIEKIDQMLSQAKLGIKPIIEKTMAPGEQRFEKDVAGIDEQAERHLRAIRQEGVPTETAETPATVPIVEPQAPIRTVSPTEVAGIPPIAPVTQPEAVETISDRLAGKKSATIGTMTDTKDGRKIAMRLVPDTSEIGTYSIVISEAGVSQTIRMQYKSGMNIADMVTDFTEYMNTDEPGRFTIELAPIKEIPSKVEPTGFIVEKRQELKRYKDKRFKTANDEKQIERIQKQLKENVEKWIPGQGVGWRVTAKQINRGLRIVEVYPETHEAKIQFITDVGELADIKVGKTQIVDMVDLVRDKKFDGVLAQPPTVAKPEATTFEKQIQTMSDTELGKSLNKMIKIRSEIPDVPIEQFRIEDTDRKIDFMQKEWERRGKAAKPEAGEKVEFNLTTVEGRTEAGTKVTARAKEIADKLGFDVSEDDLFTTVAAGTNTRGTSHGDAGISMFLREDATQEQIDRIIIHELSHTINPPKEKGLSNQFEYEKEARKFEEEQIAKLKEIEAKPEAAERGKKTIPELQAEIDSLLRQQKSPPTELLVEINAARREKRAGKRPPAKPPGPPEPGVTFKEPPRPEGPNVLMVAEVEKRLDEKAMLSENRKLRPGARRLAKQFVGKTELKKMTEEELATFGQVIGKLPEPTYNNKGQRIPPQVPKTTAITKGGEFEGQYAEPTFMRIFHAPEYYAEKLGVKSLVEKAEAGKLRFSLEYQQLSNKVDGWIKQVDKLGGTKLSEKAQAKLRNQPTKAVARFREILDSYDEPPDALNPKEKELFNNFRELTRWLLKRENAVRESLELEPILYRKGYVRHVAKGLAKDMMTGRYPFPQGRKFWAEEIIAKKIYNTMEMHRTMTEDLEELFSRDLGFATKSMLWTALKEIHLSQPIRYLEQQLTAKGKDTPVYKNLSPSEKAKWDKVATIPSRTRRWVKDYVNVTIKGQQSQLDQDIEAIVKKTGLNGLLNKLLAPFGRALSHKPVSNFVQEAGRAQILGVLGGPIGGRPRQIMRNKFQVMQSMALYPLYKETWRTYAPIRALRKTTPDLERMLGKSLFLKAYTGTEEWPVDIKSKIAKASLRAYQWSAVTNARQAMETAYWGMMPLFNKEKFKYYGWADPQRTYTEKPEFLYPSEEKLMLKEMEFGAAATQHNYTPIGMPEMFRHKTLTPITRLQSWWMNHYFRFTEEAMRRAFTGKPTYSKEGGPTLPWKYRLGWLRYALIAVPILNMMRYQRSYFFGAAPTGVPPFAQFAQGMYNYVVGKGAGSEQQWKRGKKQMIQSGKTFIPGYMAFKDVEAVLSGRKDLESLFFYKKR